MTKTQRVATGASSTELASSLETARSDLEVAERAVADSTVDYESNLLDDTPAESRRRFEAKTDAGIAVDRAAAMVRSIEMKLAAAIEKEAAAHRSELMATARKKSESARKRVESEYPAACEQIRDLLRAVAEAEISVQAANAAAIDGEPRLQSVESFRELPNLYREDLSTRRATLWCTSGDTTQPLGPEYQGRVVKDGKRAYIQTQTGSLAVEQRTFDVKEYLPHTDGRYPSPLATVVSLPALGPNEGEFWYPVDSASPVYVLRQLDAQRRPASTVQLREPVVEYHRVSD